MLRLLVLLLYSFYCLFCLFNLPHWETKARVNNATSNALMGKAAIKNLGAVSYPEQALCASIIPTCQAFLNFPSSASFLSWLHNSKLSLNGSRVFPCTSQSVRPIRKATNDTNDTNDTMGQGQGQGDPPAHFSDNYRLDVERSHSFLTLSLEKEQINLVTEVFGKPWDQKSSDVTCLLEAEGLYHCFQIMAYDVFMDQFVNTSMPQLAYDHRMNFGMSALISHCSQQTIDWLYQSYCTAQEELNFPWGPCSRVGRDRGVFLLFSEESIINSETVVSTSSPSLLQANLCPALVSPHPSFTPQLKFTWISCTESRLPVLLDVWISKIED